MAFVTGGQEQGDVYAEESKKFKSSVLWHFPATNALKSFKILSWGVVSLFSVKTETEGAGEE